MSLPRLRPTRVFAARGYTAVEVLMAMTVMAIGAASVISMQKAAMQGNLDARKTDMANSIARMWIERIQRDAMRWTIPGPANPATAPPGNIAAAAVLKAAADKVNAWILPDQYLGSTPPLSPGFDILGRDLVPDDSALFCVGVRLNWLTTNQLARVDVRVIWPRGITSNPANVCAQAAVADPGPNSVNYHSVYLTTAVRGNPQ
jgi:prepilin-type N-terminal cleavage/methylation domain-containing protein